MHGSLQSILITLDGMNGIKYGAYRTAMKLRATQKLTHCEFFCRKCQPITQNIMYIHAPTTPHHTTPHTPHHTTPHHTTPHHTSHTYTTPHHTHHTTPHTPHHTTHHTTPHHIPHHTTSHHTIYHTTPYYLMHKVCGTMSVCTFVRASLHVCVCVCVCVGGGGGGEVWDGSCK